MVRNNRRKAFTIVELVIVIAVIAILAAVMIPTFGGIIKRANISADTQLAASINTQLSIYKAEGNKIETEADLINALRSDTDFTSHLNPKSAKHGYHFWYNAEKQTVELLSNDEVLTESADLRERVQAQVFAAGGDGVAVAASNPLNFASSAPRRVVPGYYFLDQVVDKDGNEISEFFATIEDMSRQGKVEYQEAIKKLEALTTSNGSENQGLAIEVLKRINATAIMTNKGAFINPAVDADGKIAENAIQYIYIPANNNSVEEDYYLNHTVHHANDSVVVKDLLKIADVKGSIEIPANVKVAEGSFVAFGEITVLVDVENNDVANLKDVFAAGAVSNDATVRIDGIDYTVDGNKVYQGETHVADLTYRNPVDTFDVSATDNVVVATQNSGYIALDTIRNGIKLTLTTSNFKGVDPELPVYGDVVWTADVAGVTIDEDGGVTFANRETFNADTITFTATAVATNDKENPVQKSFTVTVVELTGATINFFSGANTGSQEIVSGSSHTPNDFIVNYESTDTTASFTLSNFVYNDIEFDSDAITAMGISTPTAIFTVDDDSYFTVDGENHSFTFVPDNIALLVGTIDTQSVDVTLSDKTGTVFSSSITVTVNDNTNTPFDLAVPSYKNGHVYQVGNGNDLSLGELFKEKKADLTLSEYKVHIYTTEPELDIDNYYHFKTVPVATFDKPSVNEDLSFAGITGNCWVVLATVSGEKGTDEDGEEIVIEGIAKLDTITNLKVEVVSANNISANEFTDLNATETAHAQHTFNTNVVLHNNLTFAGASNKPVIVLSNGADLYANYFTIKAEKFVDTTGATSDGYSFMKTSANSIINNLILQGPVYPEIATPNDGTGYFCFGIITEGDNTINGSYLFGFLSPVRVHGVVQIDINNTVFEGGTWSNLWINTAQNVNLTNVTTIQDHTKGYAPTVDATGSKTEDQLKAMRVLGMGIYINDDLAERSDNTTKEEMSIKLHNVIQYNWVPETGGLDFGGNVNLAKQIVFAKDGRNYHYETYLHPVSKVKYANAAIAYQCLDLTKIEIWMVFWIAAETSDLQKVADRLNMDLSMLDAYKDKNMPTIKGETSGTTVTYNFVPINDSDFRVEYSKLGASMSAAISRKLGAKLTEFLKYLNPRVGVDVWAASPSHLEQDGKCAACLDDFSTLPNVFDNFNPVIDYNDK
ncbi:MAG: type II secretion system protein [Clostridia bacterium]|nr:type II secretion system protein [Clostridia bacterium]